MKTVIVLIALVIFFTGITYRKGNCNAHMLFKFYYKGKLVNKKTGNWYHDHKYSLLNINGGKTFESDSMTIIIVN